MTKLKFKLLHEKAVLPAFIHDGDAAFDLYSVEDKVLEKGKVNIISLGLASEIPQGYYVSFRDRSGLAAKNGIHTMAGVIDSNYRGEWKVVLINLGEETYEVKVGDRIAQGLLIKLPRVEIVQVDELDDSERNEKGFGSSGRK